jgi:CubicO group peptidase (beta-lactamase class C family)
MTRKLSADAEAAARSVLDSVTSEPSPCIPGVVYCAVDKHGEIIFSHASGKIGLTEKTEMSTDSIFWMASCTKLITSIACMQLVEQGKLSLDDADQIISLAPELGKVQVLERDGENGFRFVPKERKITLRMLLNHTCKKSPDFKSK